MLAGGMATAPAVAQAADADSVTISQLKEELARRDAVIIDLANRVRALEEDRRLPASASPSTSTATSSPEVASGERAGSAPSPPLVDEIAAERALERTLVREGAALLPPGRAEVTAAFSFSPSHIDFPVLVTTPAGTLLGQRRHALETFDWRLGVDVGLPWDAQLEISTPYRLVRQRNTDTVGGIWQGEDRASGSGAGDLELGLAKTLIGRPSSGTLLVGRLTWDTGSGSRSAGGVDLGGGYSSLSGQLSASWRRDPVVFFASGAYRRYLGGTIRPGDTVGLSLGAAVALSPDTALTFALDQSYARAFTVAGVTQNGSEVRSAMLDVSAATIVGDGVLLRVKAGVGLTPGSPDYQFGLGVSVPIRLSPR
jgi:hypothetical protein